MSAEPDARPRWEGRSQARDAALRMLYQIDVGRVSPAQAARLVGHVGAPEETIELEAPDHAFAVALAAGAWDARSTLDEQIGEAARNWRVPRMAAIDRLVLRLAVRELTAHPETPPRVVIDEAIELARTYSGDEAARFVNGVLDAVLKKLQAEGSVVE